MTTPDPYDDPAWGGEFFKFEQDGDKIYGRLEAIDFKDFEADGERKAARHPVYMLLQKGEKEPTEVTINYADLKSQLRRLRPQPGDFVGIRRNRKVGNKVLFDVEVRGAGQKTPPAAPAATEDLEEAPF